MRKVAIVILFLLALFAHYDIGVLNPTTVSTVLTLLGGNLTINYSVISHIQTTPVSL